MMGFKRIFVAPGQLAVEQAAIGGIPLTWNPDDGYFYVHARGTADGTAVLGRFRAFRNAVQFAKKKSHG